MSTIKNKYIAVEGVIGVGKTTLAKLLSEKFEAKLILEIVEENPFLSEFYDDIAGKAYQTQMFFLLSRYRQMKKYFQIDAFQTNIVSDYMFMKDSIFADLTLNDAELAMYKTLFMILNDKLVQPDLIIYLYADLELIIDRIHYRNRSFEHNIKPKYLANLAIAYDKFISTHTGCPIIKLDTNNINFAKSAKQFDKLLVDIKKVLQD
ncbi:MAG: deoxynucleoside kinase [Candidatus Celaenobacter polaris]|nr:deoxynucleoside kinase [Candidatus Celaenobacter polaris]